MTTSGGLASVCGVFEKIAGPACVGGEGARGLLLESHRTLLTAGKLNELGRTWLSAGLVLGQKIQIKAATRTSNKGDKI